MAKYLDAIQWMVYNDDTEWVKDIEPIPSVTAYLVADMFGKHVDQVTLDIIKVEKKARFKRMQEAR